jgi:hypothetical protein
MRGNFPKVARRNGRHAGCLGLGASSGVQDSWSQSINQALPKGCVAKPISASPLQAQVPVLGQHTPEVQIVRVLMERLDVFAFDGAASSDCPAQNPFSVSHSTWGNAFTLCWFLLLLPSYNIGSFPSC